MDAYRHSSRPPLPENGTIHPSMLVTGASLPGYRTTRALGIVEGIAQFPSFGGTQSRANACTEACRHMADAAASRGANAVVDVSIAVIGEFSEVVAYGTAVIVE